MSSQPRKRLYACHRDGCIAMFGKWGDCRMHMRNACHVTGTPNMKQSLEKGDALQLLQPPRPPPEPIAPVPELELLNFVREYFSGGPATHDYRCQVLTRVRTRFVDCPFAEFGYGTFREFCIKHGLDPPPIKEKKRHAPEKRDRVAEEPVNLVDF